MWGKAQSTPRLYLGMSTQNPPLTAQQQRRENILKSLRAISDFGWLRAPEMGAFVWPQNALPSAPASPLVRAMLAENLIRAHALPDRAGRALMLSRRGAATLRKSGIEASACDRWEAPSSWRHDLLAAGLLGQLHRRGWEVISEARIRGKVGGLVAKIPDGLARDPSGAWWWVEIENARKTGPALRHLAQTAAAIGSGSVGILGVRPAGLLVGYTLARDEGGDRVDHRLRVTRAIAGAAEAPVPVLWACCELQGCSVIGLGLQDERIASDRVRKLLAELSRRRGGGWLRTAENVLEARYGDYAMTVALQEAYQPPWTHEATGPGIVPYAGAEVRPTSATITEAKAAAAQLVADALAAAKAREAAHR